MSKRRVAERSGQDRPRLGRGPGRAQQPVAALVDRACSGSPSSSASATSGVYPGLGTWRGHRADWTSAGQYQEEMTRRREASTARIYQKFAADRREDARRGSPGARRGRRSCSSTTARTATPPTRAAARAFRTSPTTTGSTAARRRPSRQTILNGRNGVDAARGGPSWHGEDVHDVAQLRALLSGLAARRGRAPGAARRPSRRIAPPATAPTARATRRSARPTSPTRSGSTARRKRRIIETITQAAAPT